MVAWPGAMEYDMENFVESCVEKYVALCDLVGQSLAGAGRLKPASTPFLADDHHNSPAGGSTGGSVIECPWCKHTFSPSIFHSVDALDAAVRKQSSAKSVVVPAQKVGPGRR